MILGSSGSLLARSGASLGGRWYESAIRCGANATCRRMAAHERLAYPARPRRQRRVGLRAVRVPGDPRGTRTGAPLLLPRPAAALRRPAGGPRRRGARRRGRRSRPTGPRGPDSARLRRGPRRRARVPSLAAGDPARGPASGRDRAGGRDRADARARSVATRRRRVRGGRDRADPARGRAADQRRAPPPSPPPRDRRAPRGRRHPGASHLRRLDHAVRQIARPQQPRHPASRRARALRDLASRRDRPGTHGRGARRKGGRPPRLGRAPAADARRSDPGARRGWDPGRRPLRRGRPVDRLARAAELGRPRALRRVPPVHPFRPLPVHACAGDRALRGLARGRRALRPRGGGAGAGSADGRSDRTLGNPRTAPAVTVEDMSKRLALALLGLAVVSACAPQSAQQAPVVAPSPSIAPTPNATATVRPPNRSDDLLLIRAAQKLRLVSAKTGDQLRERPDGILVDEAKAVYVAVPVAGATKVARIDLATGQELRAITFDGHYVLRYLYDGPGGLSPNGRWLTLVDPNVCQQSFGSAPPPTPQPCVSRYTILDTALDRQPRRVELQGNLWIEAISTDGRSLYLRENLPPQQPSDQHLRIYDLERRTLLAGDVPTAGGAPPTYTYGHTGPEVFSPDGKVRYTLYPFSGDVSAPMVLVLDLDGRSVRRITLPTWSFTPNEEASAWTQLLSPDGATLYAGNGLIGAFIAIDPAP